VSEYTAKEARFAFGRTVDVIPNWVDGELFRPQRDTVIREKFRLLFVGGLSRRKGKDLLPLIMSALGDDFELLYTGRPEDFGENLPGNMVSIGTIESRKKLLDYYTSSDALLLPTRLEGLPLVVLEAMACGLPVIATDCSSLPEVIMDQVTGLLCPLDDVEGFVNKIKMFNAHPNWRRSMSQEARKVAVNKFAPNALVSKYVQVYEEILNRREFNSPHKLDH
jgi:glycosyltransferase involved in cell wall biosynthesis